VSKTRLYDPQKGPWNTFAVSGVLEAGPFSPKIFGNIGKGREKPAALKRPGKAIGLDLETGPDRASVYGLIKSGGWEASAGAMAGEDRRLKW